jgi:predicted nuclease with TOPRIM domain
MDNTVKLSYGDLLAVKDFFANVENGNLKKFLYKLIYCSNARSMSEAILDVSKKFDEIQKDNAKVIDGFKRYQAAASYVVKNTDKEKNDLIEEELKRVNEQYKEEIENYQKFEREVLDGFMRQQTEVTIKKVDIRNMQMNFSDMMSDSDIPLIVLDYFVEF